jgi:NAD(P)-dependent dehydrogenase (short-subunit alcohol dehydrogenase family)
MLDAIAAQLGELAAVVHCAARFESLTPLENIPPEEWLQNIQVNLNAAWLLSAMCLPMLRRSGSGRLYFLLEDLARVGGPLWGPYGICKHALHAMVGQLAAECEGSGVQVLGIDPGHMQSPLRARAYHAENPVSAPTPERAARVIVDLLAGRQRPLGPYLSIDGGK